MNKAKVLYQAKIIKNLDEVKILNENDDYFEDLSELENYFQIYLSDHFKIHNPIFVFGSSAELNAWAWSKNGVNAVCINYASTKFMRDFVSSFKTELIDCIRLFELNEYYSVSIHAIDTMMRVSEMFLFFHETYHLIQAEEPILQNEFSDEEISSGKFDIVDHISEMDADFCACRRISTHILSMMKQETRFSTRLMLCKYLEDLTIISIIGYMLYRLILNDRETKFYFKEKTHPHMSIRITYCMIHITEGIKRNTVLPFKNKRVTTTVMTFLERLAEVLPHHVPVKKFVDEGKPHIKSVALYVHELHQLILDEPATALNKSNKKRDEDIRNIKMAGDNNSRK